MRQKENKVIVTFHTTAEAIAMEKACLNGGIPGRLIPVPRQISSGCVLAYCRRRAGGNDFKIYEAK